MVHNRVKGLVLRDKIKQYIEEHPGVTLNKICEALNLSKGQAEHHVKLLRQRNAIKAETGYLPRPTLIFFPKVVRRKTGPKKEETVHKPFSLKKAFATLLGAFK